MSVMCLIRLRQTGRPRLVPRVPLVAAIALAYLSVAAVPATALAKPTVNGLDFISAARGWVVGGEGRALVLRTSSGGHSWVTTTLRSSGGPPTSVEFVDRTNGWAAGTDFWRTTNAGRYWRWRDSLDSSYAQEIRFTRRGPLVGWVVDGNVDDRTEHAGEETYTVLRTTDGGKTWSRISSGAGSAFTDVAFVSETRGWAVGVLARDVSLTSEPSWRNLALIRSTTDGGTTWSAPLGPADFGISADRPSHLWAVEFKNALCGWAVGDVTNLSGRSHGLVLRTVDGGVTWKMWISSRFRSLTRISMATTRSGWATGEEWGSGHVLRTVDGGRTWALQSLPKKASAYDIDAVSKTVAFAAGVIPGRGGMVARTRDGGAHWARIW
jgi:photosystem II stability/assembly factor-like uncharacterized protein